MVNKIFASVANVLKRVSKGTGLSYNELNVVVYYFIIPLTWCFLLDKIFRATLPNNGWLNVWFRGFCWM
ncbi:MAG: hypothetical protein IPG89_15335 [Bacteroidetes bacterium]|nr:hypothetical protein [Bacteroidota bacterium]